MVSPTMLDEPTDDDLTLWLDMLAPNSLLTGQERNWKRTIRALQAARKRLTDVKIEASILRSKLMTAETKGAKLEIDALTFRTSLESIIAGIDADISAKD